MRHSLEKLTPPRYFRPLFGAALTATFIGAAIAQTTSDDKSQMPASKSTPPAQKAQPSDQPTDKMKGQTDAQAPKSDQTGKNTTAARHAKPATRQANKSPSQSTAALDPNEKAFRSALRECAKQQDQSQRDSCLDTAIEQFQRG